ncbi:MAG: zf-TFIIB domain-containing protein [Anaerolineae bacterium]|jgi:Zn-finger nucleic acid-binding protein|nr:zf-TFIIB domain-containing protein [Anaerolineae bacterium]
MNCPKCNSELTKKYYKGMFEVDACPNCRGMWLDFNELDALEDVVFDDDIHKGSLVHFQTRTEVPCPHCGSMLNEFQYRLYDLKLDACTTNDHGFWLDAGEDERVMELMQKRASETQRKISAEAEWKQILKDMHSFLEKKK